MTLQEFLDKLAKTPRNWEVCGHRIAQRGRIGDCPLEVVFGHSAMCSYTARAKEAGLSYQQIRKIMNAADYIDYKPQLRARLLEACGLEE